MLLAQAPLDHLVHRPERLLAAGAASHQPVPVEQVARGCKRDFPR
jgi:hypothetical protein